MGPAPHVDRRYEMISQPVLPGVPSPRLRPTWAREREDKTKRTNLLQTLDRLAYEMLRKSLKEDIQIGEKLDRKRYEEFARGVVTRSDPPALISHDIEAMRQEWSAPFEITERVANVHKVVFSSSTVRLLTCPFSGAPLTSIDRRPCMHSLRTISWPSSMEASSSGKYAPLPLARLAKPSQPSLLVASGC